MWRFLVSSGLRSAVCIPPIPRKLFECHQGGDVKQSVGVRGDRQFKEELWEVMRGGATTRPVQSCRRDRRTPGGPVPAAKPITPPHLSDWLSVPVCVEE